jgi:hypothetical protein
MPPVLINIEIGEDQGAAHMLRPRQDRTIAPELKNRILLENYYFPGDLEAKIGDFVAHYNHLRYYESIADFTPTDVLDECVR